MKTILSIDPGRDKTGIAVLTPEGEVIFQEVMISSELKEKISFIINQYVPEKILIGQGTFSSNIKTTIYEISKNIPVIMVNEKNSTELAKIKYFKKNPPGGLWKFIPCSMQVPKEPYDDYAAIIIAENYLKNIKNS